MTLAQIRDVLGQAKDLGTVETIFFEGGEPFLFYPIMLDGLREAASLGFKTGIVTNCYWATCVEDAVRWLRPLAEIGVASVSLSTDLFHGEAMMTQAARNAIEAAQQLGLPENTITIEAPRATQSPTRQTKVSRSPAEQSGSADGRWRSCSMACHDGRGPNLSSARTRILLILGGFTWTLSVICTCARGS